MRDEVHARNGDIEQLRQKIHRIQIENEQHNDMLRQDIQTKLKAECVKFFFEEKKKANFFI